MRNEGPAISSIMDRRRLLARQRLLILGALAFWAMVWLVLAGLLAHGIYQVLSAL